MGKDIVNKLCGCGRELRYSHGSLDVMSCNKYAVCLTYAEQYEQIKLLKIENLKYQEVLEKIVKVNAMDYEYKAWAKQAITPR
jgi:hypothetical protein